MFVCVDTEGRITAFNRNDMTENSGWTDVPEQLEEPIFNEDGVALLKLADGHAVERTAEEIAADTPGDPEPTEMEIVQQRLDEQDDALIELAALIDGGE